MDKSLQVIFSGDVCFNGSFAEKIRLNQPVFTPDLRKELQYADFHITNFEGPELPVVRSENSVINQPGSINYLTESNIRVFSLANNHVFDEGDTGFLETIKKIREQEAIYLGAGQTIEQASGITYLKHNGITLAVIAAGDDSKAFAGKNQYGIFSIANRKLINKRIKEARQHATYVVLMLHLGEEYTVLPSPHKRRTIKRLIRKNPPDLVIGHHSHTFQSVEQFGNTTIFYSLGNFVFDWETHKQYEKTAYSALIKVDFSEATFNFRFIPIRLDREKGNVSLMDASSWEIINSDTSLEGYYKKWYRETYRVVFRRNRLKENDNIKAKTDISENRLFHTFNRIVVILRYRSLRQLYFPAVVYAFISKFKKW